MSMMMIVFGLRSVLNTEHFIIIGSIYRPFNSQPARMSSIETSFGQIFDFDTTINEVSVVGNFNIDRQTPT